MSDTELYSISEELKRLAAHCHELHRQHHTALGTLKSIHRLVEQGESIRVHYQCEDRDIGDVLEELHATALDNVKKGQPAHFGTKLLEALQYTSFLPTNLKN